MANFREMIRKRGEAINHYVHTFESSRDSTTNLKESQWAALVEITGLVRSQPEGLSELSVGLHEAEVLVILTREGIDSGTVPSEHDVFGWVSKYYDVVMVEAMYFKKELDYYKCTCMRRVEFLGS